MDKYENTGKESPVQDVPNTTDGGKERVADSVDGSPGPEKTSEKVISPKTRQAVHALRQLATKLENGELGSIDFTLVIPKLENGDMPMLFLGEPVPNIMLEGMLHRMLTKMALEA